MLYDADCGFCMRAVRVVPRLGVRVTSAAIQQSDLALLGVDEARALREMPYVHPDGRVDYGHRAWAAILRTGSQPWRSLGRLLTCWPIDPLAARMYEWVARNRGRMPGGTPTCSLEHRPQSPSS